MPQVSGIAHVSLTVRNLAISENWYRRVLGLERVLEDRTPDYDEVLLVHRGSGVLLGLRQHHIGVTARFDESRIGLDHVALSVPDAISLVDWHQRLQELGVECSELIQHRTGTVIVLRDPDHIQLELHCPAPQIVWAGDYAAEVSDGPSPAAAPTKSPGTTDSDTGTDTDTAEVGAPETGVDGADTTTVGTAMAGAVTTSTTTETGVPTPARSTDSRPAESERTPAVMVGPFPLPAGSRHAFGEPGNTPT